MFSASFASASDQHFSFSSTKLFEDVQQLYLKAVNTFKKLLKYYVFDKTLHLLQKHSS